VADVQNDASDRRTIKLPNGSEIETTAYQAGQYDVLAVLLFPFTGTWEYAYMWNKDCKRSRYKKYAEQDREYLLSTVEKITFPLQAPRVSSLDELLDAG
jgi:hypothetical protein